MSRGNIFRWLIVIVLLAMALWSSVEMWNRFENHVLWGYLPLLCFFGFWNGTLMALGLHPFGSREKRQLFLWPLLGAVALSLSFPPFPFPVIAMLGFVPLLLLADAPRTERGLKKKWIIAGYHCFINWNILTTFWVANTAFAAGVVAIVVNSLFMLVPWLLFLYSRHRIGFIRASFIFISFWITFEFLHHRWELTWPWLTLGNSLASMPFIAQWYEFTGTLGGSLWLLAGNWWAYLVVKRWRENYRSSAMNLLKFRLLPWILVPMVCSAWLYFSIQDGESEVMTVAVIQPNFEPHYEKFEIPQSEQILRMVGQVETALERGAEVVVLPETSLRVDLHRVESDERILTFASLLRGYPGRSLIAGLNSIYIFREGEIDPEFLRIHVQPGTGDTTYWESHNSVGVIDGDGLTQLYYKSKLVPGAEIFPFSDYLFFLEDLVDQLGGSTSGLRTQEERTAFSVQGHRLAPVICYESIFGDFHRGYFDDGAEAIVIMTNDGWWDRTPGHIQHLKFGALRAIEFRKEIARSANTGISGFIDEKGRIRLPTEYEEEAIVIDELKLNNRETLYRKYGDYIGRLATLLSIGFLLMIPAVYAKSQMEKKSGLR